MKVGAISLLPAGANLSDVVVMPAAGKFLLQFDSAGDEQDRTGRRLLAKDL